MTLYHTVQIAEEKNQVCSEIGIPLLTSLCMAYQTHHNSETNLLQLVSARTGQVRFTMLHSIKNNCYTKDIRVAS